MQETETKAHGGSVIVSCSPPGSSVHGILQARALEWVAISKLLHGIAAPAFISFDQAVCFTFN